jgi:predicted AAA+ superfamily ATPase
MIMIYPAQSKSYGIVVGPHSVGKSTLIRQRIRQMKESKGIVYFLFKTKDVKQIPLKIRKKMDISRTI